MDDGRRHEEHQIGLGMNSAVIVSCSRMMAFAGVYNPDFAKKLDRCLDDEQVGLTHGLFWCRRSRTVMVAVGVTPS
jgi:hypothetical protein